MTGAKKHYAGYKQGPPPANTTGNVVAIKGGTRRVKDNKVGRGKRSILYYKGDRVGIWTKSGGNTTQGTGGLGWYMDRGYGTPKKPVPDNKLTRRLGIAGKGKKGKGKMLVPGGGFNPEEEWEVKSLAKKKGKKLQAESFEAEKRKYSYSKNRTCDECGGGTTKGRHHKHCRECINCKECGWSNTHGMMFKDWRTPSGATMGYGFGAESFDATKFSDAAKKPNYSSKGNKLYHKGDLVGKRDSKGNLTRKGVNTGRGWYMERGYGHPAKPIPDTPLTRRLGIANSGRQMRQAGGLFGKMKRMLVPSKSGFNTGQDWEMQYAKKHKGWFGGLFQGEDEVFNACCTCANCSCDCHC
jgi:hypothetical protein